MIPEPEYVLANLCLPDVLRPLWSVAIGHREVLPDHDAVFLANVVESLRFHVAGAPDPQDLDTHVPGGSKRPLIFLVGKIGDGVQRKPVHSFHEYLLAVDDKLPVVPPVLNTHSGAADMLNSPDSKVEIDLVRGYPIHNKLDFSPVIVGGSHAVGPPQFRIVQFKGFLQSWYRPPCSRRKDGL